MSLGTRTAVLAPPALGLMLNVLLVARGAFSTAATLPAAAAVAVFICSGSACIMVDRINATTGAMPMRVGLPCSGQYSRAASSAMLLKTDDVLERPLVFGLNARMATGLAGIYSGGKGVMVRDPFDGYENDTTKQVVPASFLVAFQPGGAPLLTRGSNSKAIASR